MISNDSTAAEFRSVVQEVLSNAHYRTVARELSEIIGRRNRAVAGANAIEACAVVATAR